LQHLKEQEMSGDGAGNGTSRDGDWKQFPYGGLVRESSVTALSAAIAIVTLYMLVLCFWHGGNTLKDQVAVDTFNRQKDILALALGLFGTVTGYYFGRIPAEKAADAAKRAEQNTRRVATDSLDKLQRQVSETRRAPDTDAHVQSLLSDIAVAKASLR